MQRAPGCRPVARSNRPTLGAIADTGSWQSQRFPQALLVRIERQAAAADRQRRAALVEVDPEVRQNPDSFTNAEGHGVA